MYVALRLILLFLLLIQASAQAADCPSSDSLYNKIYSIAFGNLASDHERLKQLLAFNEATKKCPSRNDSIYSYLLRRIGAVYGQLNDYKNAIYYTKLAINVIEDNTGKSSINLSHLPICYYNLHLYYDSTRQEVLKRNAIDSCIAIDLRVGGNYFYSSYLIADKLDYLIKQGDLIRCINYSTLIEKLFQNSDTNQLKAKCNTIIYHANVLRVMKRYKEAEDLLNREMPTFRARPEFMGSVYTLIGIINFYVGSPDKALASFFTAVEFHLKTDHKAAAYHWIGYIYATHLKQLNKGLDYYRKALAYASSTDAVPVLTEIGTTQIMLNSFDSAFHFFQLAFDKIRPGSNEKTAISDIFDKHADDEALDYVTNLLVKKGNAYLKLFKVKGSGESLADALSVYMIADKFLNQLQALDLELESKLFWRDNARELYEKAIEASYLSQNAETAFYFFERSRAAILNAQLNEQRWMPEEEMISLSELKREIYSMERSLAENNKTNVSYVNLQKDILERKEQLERMQQGIRIRYPLYYQRYLDTLVLAISDVRRDLLKDHDAIVELFQGDSAVYVLIMDKQRTRLDKINKAQFDQLSQRYINFISNGEESNAKYNEFVQTSHQLYSLIFKNVTLPEGRIIFSPDGKYFPFESLVTNMQSVVYFLEKHAVSYTYSVRYLLHDKLVAHGSKSKSQFFGVAPIQFNPSLQLSGLTGSDGSLDRINNNFSSHKSLIGEAATRKNFLEQFDRYAIIQLYTHATDSGSAGEPMIYFHDSTLSLSELIYGRKPMTELVVLSACETGLGRLYMGEGVFNFNRGFAAMGVPSSISNLWLVETQATYRLTELFYQHLANGLPSDIALQKAKQQFMREGETRRNQLPYLWAAPILVGDSNFTIEEKTFSWLWWLLLLPVCIVIIWWMRKVSRQS